MTKIRLLVADDHAVVRQGIRQILAEAPDFDIVREATDGVQVLERLRDARVDVVVLDLSMPMMSGLEVIKQIRKEFPLVAILVLSFHSEEQYAVRVMKAGASGYLTKGSEPEELIAALRSVSKGRKYVTGTLAERLAVEVETGTDKLPHEMLSDREYEVLCLIASGLTVQEIAEKLILSVKTVSTYRTRLVHKMKMHGTAELTRYALTHGLVD